MAQRVHRQRVAAETREARRHTTEAVQAADQERTALYNRLDELIAALETSQPGVYYGANISGVRTVSTGVVSVGFTWNGSASNSISGGKLTLYVTKSPMSIHGWETENARVAATYELHLAEDNTTWQWVDLKTSLQYSSQLAENAVRRLIEEDEKQRQARLQRQQRRF